MKQNNSQQTTQPAKGNRSGLVTTIVLIVLAVLFVPILIINLTLIVKGSLHDDVPPDIFGVAPLAVASGSMSGDADDCFDEGALIFVDLLEGEEKQSLQEGQIVTYYTGEMFVTHRIISVERAEDGRITGFITKGDANNTDDGVVPVGNVVGLCTGSVAGLGDFALFMQTPMGILVFVGIPVVIFIAFDVIRITLERRRQRAASDGSSAELAQKDEEIRRLRAMLGEQSAAAPAEEAESAPGSEVAAAEEAEPEVGESAAEEAPAETAESETNPEDKSE